MSETMIAFIALFLVVIFSMNQKRTVVRAEQEIAGIELEVLAHAVGSDMMQRIAAKDFDNAMSGSLSQELRTSDLTLPTNFGSGKNCPSACNDIDDFNNMQPDTVFFEIDTDEWGDPIGFDFVVEAAVQYVDEEGNATNERTWTKEVTLQIDQASSSSLLIQPIIMQQQFSPQW
jgi:hypothetical protein